MLDKPSSMNGPNHPKRIKLDETIDDHCIKAKSRKSHLYEDKLILAPMVRANSLPFRLLCLRQGADLVYSEELIDHRVVTCKRVENHLLGTIDFVDKDKRIIFRTCEEEKGRVVFQLGSNDPERALKAAKLVSQDVMGLDFNFGCPKKFSIAGGMGAALLENPQKIQALLTTCVKELDIPVTCKIRLLPSLESTLSLVKLIESCGVSAIAVHGRTRDQRPAHDNDIATLKAISEGISIPLIANGESNNLRTYEDIIKFRQQTNASSVMIARAAMKNPAIFRGMPSPKTQSTVLVEHNEGSQSIHERDIADTNLNLNVESPELNDCKPTSGDNKYVNDSNGAIEPVQLSNMIIQEYVKLAVRYDNHPSNVKYSLQSLMSNSGSRQSKEFMSRFHRATSLSAIAELFHVSCPTAPPPTQQPPIASDSVVMKSDTVTNSSYKHKNELNICRDLANKH